MLFNIYLIIMSALIISLLAFYIALRVSPRLLDRFDEWLEPVRNFIYKEEE